MEPEFLDRAKRGDHKSLKILTQHFKACARADGSKPAPPDGLTMAEVGDRFVLKGDLAKTSAPTVREALEKFTRRPAPNDGRTLAVRQAEGFVRVCEIGQPWEHGGATRSDNGLLLCRRHHTFLHARSDWTATFDAQALRVHRPDGTEVHHDPWTNMDWAA